MPRPQCIPRSASVQVPHVIQIEHTLLECIVVHSNKVGYARPRPSESVLRVVPMIILYGSKDQSKDAPPACQFRKKKSVEKSKCHTHVVPQRIRVDRLTSVDVGYLLALWCISIFLFNVF